MFPQTVIGAHRQTQRSLQNFRIGGERMPLPLVHALGVVKRAAAETNIALGKLDPVLGQVIAVAASEVIEGKLDDHFPLVVWQTGSGTQSNMNANEVISNRAIELLGGEMGSKKPIHPNDHVNMSQSSNDSFPTAIHIATAVETVNRLYPALEHLTKALKVKEEAFKDIIKIGRTHTQDATPVTLGQEFSGYRAALEYARHRLEQSLADVFLLAQGGTAVGTGLNAPVGFDKGFAEAVSEITGLSFKTAPNKFEALAKPRRRSQLPRQPECACSRSLQDRQRYPVSRFRPAFRPWRAFSAGKRTRLLHHAGQGQPTQAEAMTMVATQVFGNQTAVTVAASQGHFELNVFKPVIAYNVLQSIRLLSDTMVSFADHCVEGIEPNTARIKELLERSLMLVTAHAPAIGYDNAARIAKTAHKNGTTLREEALASGLVSEEDYDRLVRAERMIAPQ